MCNKRIFVFPGSFDPPTIGHVDIIERASTLCDCLYVCILHNIQKQTGLFNMEERQELLKAITKKYDNVHAVSYDGLLIDFCKDYDCNAIIKGIRDSSDLSYELNMAAINKSLSNNKIETLFLPSSPELTYVSSSMVRELLSFKASVDKYVPEEVIKALKG